MNPSISNPLEERETYSFTLSGINVSFANALRRTILTDIPTVAFHTENYKDNDCKVAVNTTRLHNEILKQRLSCIPVHMGIDELDILPGNYVMELDVLNETEQMIIITSHDFKIRNKSNNNYLTQEEVRKIFPPHPLTQMYIDFARVRPKISDSIPGEQLKLTAEFSVRTARENSMFNVVSKCAYSNTIDIEKVKQVWDEREQVLRADKTPIEDIEYEKRNFYLLDAQRQFVPDSFDFVIQTVGVYENKQIVEKATKVLHDKLVNFVTLLDNDAVPIQVSETTMENCYDVVLENEDYTLGKILEYVFYNNLYIKEKTLSFCGFKVFHPHNTSGTLRIAYTNKTDKGLITQHLRDACVEAVEVFSKLANFFAK